jgi:succinyl-CoA synthetase beta subunit
VPRQKISEYRAKLIIAQALGLPYKGWSIDADKPLSAQLKEPASATGPFVLKVDEGVKGRFKQGLVLLDVKSEDLGKAVKGLRTKGYRWFIVEPMAGHSQSDERYLSLMSDRDGLTIKYTASGGVDIEQHADSVKSLRLNNDTKPEQEQLAAETGFSAQQLRRLVATFTDNYFVFLEINPYLAGAAGIKILDAAVEVDDAAAFFVDSWQADDFRRHTGHGLTPEERVVQELDANSPASLKLSVLEPNGGIFLLLSGGGASVVIADEVYNQGYGKQLANYGEYSGNPNAEETYEYTKQLLRLLLQSSARRKVLFIGGAVANFTDVAKTFAGVIRAIDEVSGKLRAEKVKVFVRRGGPNQEAGLAQMEKTLAKYGLLGAVHDPRTPLTAAVTEALGEVAHE